MADGATRGEGHAAWVGEEGALTDIGIWVTETNRLLPLSISSTLKRSCILIVDGCEFFEG